MSKDLYEVYVVSVDDDVLYIGQGKLGRHQHCDSGLSHVYGLNRLHFGKVKLKVEVVETFKTKAESEKREFELIKKFNPKFNLKNNGDSSMWGLNNKYYLDHLCNIKPEKPHEEYDECCVEVTEATVGQEVVEFSMNVYDPVEGFFGEMSMLCRYR